MNKANFKVSLLFGTLFPSSSDMSSFHNVPLPPPPGPSTEASHFQDSPVSASVDEGLGKLDPFLTECLRTKLLQHH